MSQGLPCGWGPGAGAVPRAGSSDCFVVSSQPCRLTHPLPALGTRLLPVGASVAPSLEKPRRMTPPATICFTPRFTSCRRLPRGLCSLPCLLLAAVTCCLLPALCQDISPVPASLASGPRALCPLSPGLLASAHPDRPTPSLPLVREPKNASVGQNLTQGEAQTLPCSGATMGAPVLARGVGAAGTLGGQAGPVFLPGVSTHPLRQRVLGLPSVLGWETRENCAPSLPWRSSQSRERHRTTARHSEQDGGSQPPLNSCPHQTTFPSTPCL